MNHFCRLDTVKVSYLLSCLMLLALGGGFYARRGAAEGARSPLTGDYVEARTASVFAGACHYNGERQTAGREAVMAWSFASGVWNGVDVSGTRVVAVVGADANLADAEAVRQTELVLDVANEPQARALQEALTENYGPVLGRIVKVRRAAIDFQHGKDGAYRVAAGVARLEVTPMPNQECCKMPQLVWYQPLARIESRRVGFAKQAFYAGGAAGEEWQRANENSAFYGEFTF